MLLQILITLCGTTPALSQIPGTFPVSFFKNTGYKQPSSYSHEMVFNYTGSDQTWTIPVAAKWLKIKAWGAGGGSGYRSNVNGSEYGGVGGFVSMELSLVANDSPVRSGDQLHIMVGQGGQNNSGGIVAYGFGGKGGCANSSRMIKSGGGGGLSGVFISSQLSGVSISNSDANAALAIAGGGGGGSADYNSEKNNQAYGGPGGDPTYPSNQTTMSGLDAVCNVDNSGKGGGGGGKIGGEQNQPRTRPGPGTLGGDGGVSFINPKAVSTQNLYGVAGSSDVPNSTDVDYVSPAGQGGVNAISASNGLVVIQWEN